MTEATPQQLGYRMPAEWERHQATWLVWPQNRTDWPGKFEPIPWVYAEIVRHLARVEDVNIIVRNATIKDEARDVLSRSGADLQRVKFHLWPTNRGWTRDSGPIFVCRNNEEDPIATTNWRFNAWAKYPDSTHDRKLPGLIAGKLKLKQFTPTVERNGKPYHVVLEGGSIDVNGAGKLLTTEECLLSDVQARNPGLGRQGIERAFHDFLGINEVIWLNRGIAGDDTHGHIDDLARFTAADSAVIVIERNKSDVNHEPLKENLDRLRARKDLRVTTLPMPEPVYFAGQRLPASYANFYIANKLVLVPTFGDRNDTAALRTLETLFRDRVVVGIPCRDLVLGLGTLHCMTQQQPAGH